MSQTPSYKPAKIPAGVPDYPENKPQLDPKLVKMFVIAAHFDFAKVKEMLEDEPGLLNAAWDWGDGDFERALEAAGHTGHREIALYLIEKGAHLNLFCQAMLGDLEIVRATLSAHPSLKTSKGPHGLSLMHHAKAGKEHSQPVLEYFKTLGLE